VEDVHHVHVWQPEEGKIALEAHAALAERDISAATELKERLKERLRERFGVGHATIEVELSGRARHDRALLQDG
jgi:cobalt-zinc-cadmium efflux system protein